MCLFRCCFSQGWGGEGKGSGGRGAFLLRSDRAELPPLESPITVLVTLCCNRPFICLSPPQGLHPCCFLLPGTPFPHISRVSSPFRCQLKCHLLQEALPDQLAPKAAQLLPVPSSCIFLIALIITWNFLRLTMAML